MKTKIFFHKEKIITSLVALACLLLYGLFPASGIFQNFFSPLAFLVLAPALYIKLILKKDLRNFGLNPGDWRQGVLWGLVLVVFGFFVVYTLANYTNFSQQYFIPGYARQFSLFILNEIFVTGFFIVLYEFFFRGFIQFSFTSKFGYGSIVLQMLAFVLFLAATGNLNWTFALYVIASPLAGIVAYRSRSIFYSALASLVFFVLADAYLIQFTK